MASEESVIRDTNHLQDQKVILAEQKVLAKRSMHKNESRRMRRQPGVSRDGESIVRA